MTDEQHRIKILREVALYADHPNFYDKAEKLGAAAAKGLTSKKRSQIKGLENIANSSLKTTDVFDFIKIRCARQKEWRDHDWGTDLLNYLSRDLRDQRNQICSKLGIDSNGIQGVHVQLLLIREFIRQLAAHYEYSC